MRKTIKTAKISYIVGREKTKTHNILLALFKNLSLMMHLTHNIMYLKLQRFDQCRDTKQVNNPLYYILSLHTKRKGLKKWRSRV